MPMTVFETRGIPATRRELIISAIEAGGKNALHPFEAWATADPVHEVARRDAPAGEMEVWRTSGVPR